MKKRLTPDTPEKEVAHYLEGIAAMEKVMASGRVSLVISSGEGEAVESLLLDMLVAEDDLFLKLPAAMVERLGLKTIGERSLMVSEAIEVYDYVAPVKLQWGETVSYTGALVGGDAPSIGIPPLLDLMGAIAPIPATLNADAFPDEDEDALADFAQAMQEGRIRPVSERTAPKGLLDGSGRPLPSKTSKKRSGR
jgi:hypothetical protein